MTHSRLWKFRPPEGGEQAFEDAYSAAGRWSDLFRRADGYLGTILLKPAKPGGWWLTIDRWRSATDFEAFGKTWGDEYRALDTQLEGVAGEEQFIGAFEQDD